MQTVAVGFGRHPIRPSVLPPVELRLEADPETEEEENKSRQQRREQRKWQKEFEEAVRKRSSIDGREQSAPAASWPAA